VYELAHPQIISLPLYEFLGGKIPEDLPAIRKRMCTDIHTFAGYNSSRGNFAETGNTSYTRKHATEIECLVPEQEGYSK
jgi:hypothetical protein